jgi:ParB/RepB/Spo0J family partition protein
MASPKAAKVTKILITRIQPNPHNPRRLFDEDPLSVLKESIDKLGVLVPITVYPRIEGKVDPIKNDFVILDGERRWRCCSSLNMRKIPAIIIEQPTETENILVMFHIHNLREGWQLMPTALKLEVLMKQLGIKSENKLKVITKLSVGQIRRCKILLSYPRKYQNLMLAPPTKRLKSDFFIELDRIRKPALREKFPPWIQRGDSKCIQIILDKYLRKIIPAVTDFRKLTEIYRGSIRVKRVRQFYRAFDKFLENKDSTIDSIVVPGAHFEKETKEAIRSANRLESQLQSLEKDAIASNEELIISLKILMLLIRSKLEDAMLIKGFGDQV